MLLICKQGTKGAFAILALCLAAVAAAQSITATVNTPSVAPRQGEPGAPYINTWLVLGTFDNNAQNAGFERDLIGESTAAPHDGNVAGGKTWRYFDDRLYSRNLDDYADLYSYFKLKLNQSVAAKVAYAHVYCFNPRVQSVQLRIGADTSFKAWLNGISVIASANSGPDRLVTDPRLAHLNSGRDYIVVPVILQSGWNRLLLKIANREAGRFGFYARLTTPEGESVPDLVFSTGGGEGALKIATRAMPEAHTGDLPVAYREWPYFDARPERGRLLEMGAGQPGPGGQQPAFIPGIGVGFSYNASLGMQASPFQLTAQGGSAPYRWTQTAGELPAGLSLAADGVLRGTPARGARLGNYAFSVEVRDAEGHAAQRAFSLTLRERPNRWVERARLTALIHGPEKLPREDMAAFAHLMKRQGYALAMPIAYNNGDMLFRWPSEYGKKHTDENWIGIYKAALEKEGIGFGMYMGNLNVPGSADFSVNQMILVVEEAMRRYHPKAFWFDWLGMDGTALDSLFSVIRSYDPDTLIFLNGSERMSNGDWDILSFEGWQAWGGERSWQMWPVRFPWPKQNTPEGWRLAVDPAFTESGGATSDWQEMLRIQLSLIGEGFIANMDHSAILPGSKAQRMAGMVLMKLHNQMAQWANPEGAPSLIEAYTKVDPGPLAPAFWGYNTINVDRDALYLIALQNPRGKSGLPVIGDLIVGPIPGQVKAVTLMNRNTSLPFTQRTMAEGTILTIELKGVVADPVATIFKVVMAAPP